MLLFNKTGGLKHVHIVLFEKPKDKKQSRQYADVSHFDDDEFWFANVAVR